MSLYELVYKKTKLKKQQRQLKTYIITILMHIQNQVVRTNIYCNIVWSTQCINKNQNMVHITFTVNNLL